IFGDQNDFEDDLLININRYETEIKDLQELVKKLKETHEVYKRKQSLLKNNSISSKDISWDNYGFTNQKEEENTFEHKMRIINILVKHIDHIKKEDENK